MSEQKKTEATRGSRWMPPSEPGSALAENVHESRSEPGTVSFTFNTQEGEHGDVVLALAIAVLGLSESTCTAAESLKEVPAGSFCALEGGTRCPAGVLAVYRHSKKSGEGPDDV